MVKSLGGRLLFEVAGPLVNLLRGLPGVDEVIELSPAGKTGRPFDLYMPLLSLPGLFKTTLDTVPANIPYVVPDPDKVRQWSRRLGPEGFKVGIVCGAPGTTMMATAAAWRNSCRWSGSRRQLIRCRKTGQPMR
jgi:hypothetical protein